MTCVSEWLLDTYNSLKKSGIDWLKDLELPTNEADSNDLQDHNFKIPIFAFYVAAFVVSFIVLFLQNYNEVTTTKFLAPKSPVDAVALGCKTEKITGSGVFKFDLDLNYAGSPNFDDVDRGSWEMKLSNFAATYDEWNEIIEKFFADLQRISDLREKQRGGGGDFGFDLVLASSYNFMERSSEVGSIEIYLPAEADSIFKLQKGYDLFNRGNNLVGISRDASSWLESDVPIIPINPTVFETSFERNGFIEYSIKNTNEKYDSKDIGFNFDFILPSSAALLDRNIFSTSKESEVTFQIDWRSATTGKLSNYLCIRQHQIIIYTIYTYLLVYNDLYRSIYKYKCFYSYRYYCRI